MEIPVYILKTYACLRPCVIEKRFIRLENVAVMYHLPSQIQHWQTSHKALKYGIRAYFQIGLRNIERIDGMMQTEQSIYVGKSFMKKMHC